MTLTTAARAVVARVVGGDDRVTVDDIGAKGWTITLYTVDGDVAATFGAFASRDAAVDRWRTIRDALTGWDIEIAKAALR